MGILTIIGLFGGSFILSALVAIIIEKVFFGPSPSDIDWCRGGHDF